MKKYLLAGLLILVVGFVGFYYNQNNNVMDSVRQLADRRNDEQKNMQATIKTNLGEIKLDLYVDDAPIAVANFVKLANAGFYSGAIFHRVIPGFMIQGGDPNCDKSGADKGQCGAGGPGYKFEDELNSSSASYQNGYKKGVLAMANAGPNTNGSQFFIMVADVPLPHNYTIFGQVAMGQEVADKIALVKRSGSDRPLQVVIIEKIEISK